MNGNHYAVTVRLPKHTPNRKRSERILSEFVSAKIDEDGFIRQMRTEMFELAVYGHRLKEIPWTADHS